LHRLGHQVEIVEDGLEALQKLQQQAFDLVLMDCQMPTMDGYSATQKIRSQSSGVQNPAIPIVALTAHAMSGDREKSLAAGMNGHLTKPFTLEDMQNLLNYWAQELKKPTLPSA